MKAIIQTTSGTTCLSDSCQVNFAVTPCSTTSPDDTQLFEQVKKKKKQNNNSDNFKNEMKKK